MDKSTGGPWNTLFEQLYAQADDMFLALRSHLQFPRLKSLHAGDR